MLNGGKYVYEKITRYAADDPPDYGRAGSA